MAPDCTIDLAYVLRSALYVIEHGEYPEKHSAPVLKLASQILNTLEDIELAREKAVSARLCRSLENLRSALQ